MTLRSCRRLIDRRLGILVLFCAVLALAGCQMPNPTEPSPNNQTTNVNVNVGSGGPLGPSPGPGGASCGTVASVRVGFFGFTCTSGTPPKNGEGVLPLRCTGDVTGTPKDVNGNDVPASVHGQNIQWAVIVGGERVSLLEQSNPFNRLVKPLAVGPVRIEATVTPPGCTAIRGGFDFQVVSP